MLDLLGDLNKVLKNCGCKEAYVPSSIGGRYMTKVKRAIESGKAPQRTDVNAFIKDVKASVGNNKLAWRHAQNYIDGLVQAVESSNVIEIPAEDGDTQEAAQ